MKNLLALTLVLVSTSAFAADLTTANGTPVGTTHHNTVSVGSAAPEAAPVAKPVAHKKAVHHKKAHKKAVKKSAAQNANPVPVSAEPIAQ